MIYKINIFRKPSNKNAENGTTNFDLNIWIKLKKSENNILEIIEWAFEIKKSTEISLVPKDYPKILGLIFKELGLSQEHHKCGKNHQHTNICGKGKYKFKSQDEIDKVQNLIVLESAKETNPLTIFGWFCGTAPSGSKTTKENEQLKIKYKNEKKRIIAFLKLMGLEKAKLNQGLIKVENAQNIESFIKNLDYELKSVLIDIYWNKAPKDFFWNERRSLIYGESKNKKEKQNRNIAINIRENRLSNKQIHNFDDAYQIYESKTIAEGAHIIPYTYAVKEHGIKPTLVSSYKNGLLLPSTIHKIFDSGSLTIDSSTGEFIFSNDPKFQLTRNEKAHIKTKLKKIDKDILFISKKFIDWHSKNVFETGVKNLSLMSNPIPKNLFIK